jgi:hypothetical protein
MKWSSLDASLKFVPYASYNFDKYSYLKKAEAFKRRALKLGMVYDISTNFGLV